MKSCEIKSLPDAKKAAEPLKNVERLLDSGVVPPALKEFAVGKRYYIKTYGCQANIRDEEILSGFLEKAGFRKTEDPKKRTSPSSTLARSERTPRTKSMARSGPSRPTMMPTLPFCWCWPAA